MEDNTNILENTLQEAFVGKTELLQQVEEQFGIMKKSLKKGQDLSSRPEVQKLNRLIERQFNIDVFCLRITPYEDIDVYTREISQYLDFRYKDLSKLVVGSPDSGYKLRVNNNICIIVNMTLGTITNSDITPSELTAVLIHELGHSFGSCMHDTIRLDNQELAKTQYMYYTWRAATTFGKKYKKYKEEMAHKTNTANIKYAKELSKQSKFRGWIKGLAGVKYNFASFCKGVIASISSSKNQAYFLTKDKVKDSVSNYENQCNNKIVKIDETFADKFAAAYGYAYELSSFLHKTRGGFANEQLDKFYKKFFGRDLSENIAKAYNYYWTLDVHPHDLQRTNSLIHSLKSELSKEDLDPKFKTVIQDQINKLEEQVKELTTAANNDEEREHNRKMFYKAVNDNAPNALSEELENEIEDILDKALHSN